MRTARSGAALVAVGVLFGAATARAQTTSARGESLELSSRADELLAAGRDDRAAPLYRRAIAIDASNERAYVGLSALLDAQQRHEEALDLLAAAEARIGWTTDLAVQRGIHLSRVRRWGEVVTALTRVLERNPRSFEAAFYLAAAHNHRRAFAEAIATYDVYLRHRPEALAERDLSVRTHRAYALLGAGRHSEARRELEAVLERAPTRRSTRMLLFTALAEGGECARALALWPSLDGVQESAPTAAYNAAVCRFRVGEAAAALAELDRARRRGPLPSESYLLAARIHATLGDHAATAASYREALAAGLPAELELATWLTGRGEHAQVVELLWPRVERSTDPEVVAALARALARTGDFDRAAVASARLVALDPSAAGWLLHGRIQLERRLWREAERAFAHVIAAEPAHRRAGRGASTALAHLANEAFRAGNRDEAHALLARAHRLDASAGDVAHHLALLELERNNPQRAIALLEGRADRPATRDATRLVLGRAQLAVGNTDAAARWFERVTASQKAPAPVRAQALANLAYVIARSNPDRAVQLIARARGQTDVGPASRAVLARAEAEAHLVRAEREYARGAFKQLKAELDRISTSELGAEARARTALLELFELGQRNGLAAALTRLGKLTDDELTAAGATLPPATLRNVLALHLGRSFASNPSEYTRYLRAPAIALHREPAVARLLTAFYDHALDLAIARESSVLAGQLLRAAPAGLRSDSFQHNAVVAAAGAGRGRKPFTKEQIGALEKLAETVPEALINLAIDAEARGDAPAVIRYLRRLPPARRTAQITEWLRWKELVHGAP